MSNPTFSVIIPAFNAEKTLRSAVGSVFLQSENDFEIILVDDGSSDRTLNLALDIACMDLRVRVVSQSNGGVSSARNLGASLAKGRFLAFLDADDQWTSDKLSRHLALHEADPELDASFAQVRFCGERNGAMVKGRTLSRVPDGAVRLSDVVVENAICTTSNFVIARKAYEALGGFDAQLRHAEDQELFARVIADGRKVRAIARPLVNYRLSEDGLSCDFEAMLAGWASFAGKWLHEDEFARAEAVYCRYLARRALRAGANMALVRSFARRGLKAHRDSFMAGGARGLFTLGGVFAGGVLPASLRRAVFA